MLNNLKLGMKLGLGFGLVLLLTAIIGFIGYTGMKDVQARVDKADDVNRVVKYLLEGRIKQLQFINNKGEKEIEELAVIFKKLYAQSVATSDKFSDKNDKLRISEAAAAAKEYEQASVEYSRLENQKASMMKNMRADAAVAIKNTSAMRENMKKQFSDLLNSGTASREALLDRLEKSENAQAMIEWFYAARKDEKEYIISHDLAL